MTNQAAVEMPLHGAYISDVYDPSKQVLLIISDNTERAADRIPGAAILPLIQRAYPNASLEMLRNYYNKGFTFIGYRSSGTLLLVYRHDYAWYLMTIGVSAYESWLGYGALPRCYARPDVDALPSF